MFVLICTVGVSAAFPTSSQATTTPQQANQVWLPLVSVPQRPIPSQASLELQAPKAVQVDQPFAITLTIKDATDIAGYETSLLYDTRAAEFDGLEQRNNDLRTFGRDVVALGPVERSDGIAMGLYSCPVQKCTDITKGPRQAKGGHGTLRLATVTLLPRQAGLLEIKFAATKFIDAAGNAVQVLGQEQTIRVQVGTDKTTHRAPNAGWTLPEGNARLVRTPDLTGDWLVNHADAMEVALAWTMARVNGVVCGPLPDTSRDLNGDKCIDVADLGLLAASYSQASAKARPHPVDEQRRRAAEAAGVAAVLTPLTFTVDSVADTVDANIGDGICKTSGNVCTLRAAIAEANAHPGADTVNFNIPGSGVQTIQLQSLLPSLNDLTGPTTIDGYTQPGSSPNTDPLVSNANIQIQITGKGVTNFTAFYITSPGNTIRGLALYNLYQPIWMSGLAAIENRIFGNFIGTNAAGTFGATLRNDSAIGSLSLYSGAAHNYLGSPALADRNVVSGSAADGISLKYEGTEYNRIVNNLIGLNPQGNRNLKNWIHGIDLDTSTSYTQIGGLGAGERNVVSGNNRDGVQISHGRQTVANRIIGNFIGIDPTGTKVFSYTGNGHNGIQFEDGVTNNFADSNVVGGNIAEGINVNGYYTSGNQISNNWVGVAQNGDPIPNQYIGVRIWYHANRTIVGPGNIIAYNPAGVTVESDDNDFNTITKNSIYANTGMGIDLQPIGVVNINDLGDFDSSANDGLNYPVLNSATPQEIIGTACGSCIIEAFVADIGTNGIPQGKTFVGTSYTNPDGTFKILASGAAEGDKITATATDASGNTSEFSPARQVTASRTDIIAADAFGRTLASGWAIADVGGPYTLAGTASNFSVSNGQATIKLPAGGSNQGATLDQASVLDADIVVRVQTDKAAASGSQFVYAVARRVVNGTEYQGRLRIDPSGRTYASASLIVGGVVTDLGAPIMVPNVTHVPGVPIWLRMQATGTNPTTIRVKAWNDGQTEPASWTYTITNSAAALQTAGAIGLRAYMSGSISNAPVQYTFSDYQVHDLGDPAATALPPPHDPNIVAADQFTRTETNGWYDAQVGGLWTIGGSSAALAGEDFNVNGTSGTVSIGVRGYERTAYLTQAIAQDVDYTATIATDKVPAVGSSYSDLIARRIGSGTEYRGGLRFAPDGSVQVQIVRKSTYTETRLGNMVNLTGVSYTPGTVLRMRFQVFGTDPTTLRIKVWRDGQAEPAAWLITATDSDPSLQTSGAIGVRSYLSGSVTNVPILFTFDNLLVMRLQTP